MYIVLYFLTASYMSEDVIRRNKIPIGRQKVSILVFIEWISSVTKSEAGTVWLLFAFEILNLTQ